MSGRTARAVLTVIIDIAIIVAVALAIRLFVLFTHEIASQQWALGYDTLTRHLAIAFGTHAIKTPYHGVFDVDTALTIVVALIAEWGLSAVRDRA